MINKMDIKKTVLDKKNFDEMREISFDELLKEPFNKDPIVADVAEIEYIHQFSLYRLFKLWVKRYLIDFLNLFLKKKKV